MVNPRLPALVAAALALAPARADELSGEDKLRLLYSHRFSFTKGGVPLVTVEIMSGQREVRLHGDKGLRLLPDGDGGPEVVAGDSWTIGAEKARAAKVRWWTIVSRTATEAEAAAWRARGLETRTFETGIVFGVEGDVIDSRANLLGVAPKGTEAEAQKNATALADRYNVETSVHPELVARPTGTLVAREAGGGAEVRNEGVLWFAAASDDGLITVEDVVHGGGGAKVAEARETRAFHGRIYVTFGNDGNLTVVNAVPEDELLLGIVPSEIFPDAPAEALKAQAVAARDELLSRIGTRHFTDPFLLCSSQHCQVYGGAGREDPRTSRAVRETRGEVLVRDVGGLAPAYYSASCGGFSENNENVWAQSPDPALRGHLDAQGADAAAMKAFAAGVTNENIDAFLAAGEHAFCARSKYAKGRHRWSVRLSDAELDRLVAAELPAVGHVREMSAAQRGVSGRIRELVFTGDRGKASVTGELRIRRLLGGLKSSLFAPRHDGGGWTLDGAGFGHGVGLCQTGAIGMAESGLTYRQILEHYYRGARVRRLY